MNNFFSAAHFKVAASSVNHKFYFVLLIYATTSDRSSLNVLSRKGVQKIFPQTPLENICDEVDFVQLNR